MWVGGLSSRAGPEGEQPPRRVLGRFSARRPRLVPGPWTLVFVPSFQSGVKDERHTLKLNPVKPYYGFRYIPLCLFAVDSLETLSLCFEMS
jgi:hypothetical protein